MKTAKIYGMFSSTYWLPEFVKSEEECDAISKLLENGDYETIETKWDGEITETDSGTIFVS